MLHRFRREDSVDAAARRLYDAIVARSRSALFHRRFKVADTIDGRFDLLTLHLYLVMDALRELGPGGDDVAETLVTLAFAGFEEALRELGVSDFGLSRRIKAMANAFYGRLDAYRLAGDDLLQLTAALTRNLYRGDVSMDHEAAQMARYVQSVCARMKHADSGALIDGSVDFGPLPEL